VAVPELWTLAVMLPKRPVEFVYVPRIWPAFAVSSGVAALLWLLAVGVGHRKGFLIFAAVAFCAGILSFVLSLRRRVGFLPLALPSPDSRTWLFRVSIGLCWGAIVFVLLLLR
jgi:hypothetical protein